MNEARIIANQRAQSKLTLRQFADLAGTSHATLSSYERGHKVPNVATLDRILQSVGTSATVTLGPTRMSGSARARELRQALGLAAVFPVRHDEALRFPPFPQRRPQ